MYVMNTNKCDSEIDVNREYLQSIKVGDTVYPCYEGKASRATKCVITEVTEDSIVVEGCLFGSGNAKVSLIFSRESGSAYTDYGLDEPTLSDYVRELICSDEGGDEPCGDYYELQDLVSYVQRGFYTGPQYKRYLEGLGISCPNATMSRLELLDM